MTVIREDRLIFNCRSGYLWLKLQILVLVQARCGYGSLVESSLPIWIIACCELLLGYQTLRWCLRTYLPNEFLVMKPAVSRIGSTCVRLLMLPLWDINVHSVLLWPIHGDCLIRQINGRWRVIAHFELALLRRLFGLRTALGTPARHWGLICGIRINQHLLSDRWMNMRLLFAVSLFISYR